jgi:hypothetical protein
MMRAMRDAGVAGHVLLCDTPTGEELEALAGRNVFFFTENQNKKTLSLLLEYQAVVAVRPSALGLVEDLMGEYEVLKIVILDAGEEALMQALGFKDPENLLCGGYCHDACSHYWKSIVKKASVIR